MKKYLHGVITILNVLMLVTIGGYTEKDFINTNIK